MSESLSSSSPVCKRLQTAMQQAAAKRPAVNGFPYFAEGLRQHAGMTKNIWYLPSCQSVHYIKRELSDSDDTDDLLVVVMQNKPLITGMMEVPPMRRGLLVEAIDKDKAGGSFPDFLKATWEAGIIRYEVDFVARTVKYYGSHPSDVYEETYPHVKL